jgi:basic membrane lipoprotein Med (substrate-binding protein (PBP1-ABC) superfamily)
MWRARTPSGVLVALVLLLAACTNGDAASEPVPSPPVPAPAPAPPIGARVAVVLPPTSVLDPAVLTALEAQLAELGADAGESVRELAGYPAADPRFVEDVTVWLAEQGTDLVCVLGERAEAVVVELAARYRDVRFCAVPSSPPATDGVDTEVDDRIVRVDLRVEELGYLVGVAARTEAGEAPIGLVLGGDELPGERFREGLLAGLAGAEVVEADVPPDEGASLADRVEAVLAADVGLVVLDGGVGVSEALEVVGDRAAVMAPRAVVDAGGAGPVALSWSVRWDLALAAPLASLVDDADEPVQVTVGLADEVFDVAVGERASGSTAAALTTASDGIVRGVLDPSVPASPETSEQESDDTDPIGPESAGPG